MATLKLTQGLAGWRWRLTRLARLPWAAPAALLLAVVLAVAATLWHHDAAQRLDAARLAQGRSAQAPAAAGDEDRGRRAALVQFIDSLPPGDDLPVVVQSLFDLAEQEGLRMARGSYRLQPEPAAAFARFHMSLPVRGEPGRVQRFLQAALQAWPSLAVESIQFKAAAGGERVLEARLQWVLFVRDGGVRAATVAASGAGS
ncbi:MAG: hypothetical protein Q8K91_01710 [Hylemonella sp.]|nr:hypothetical protein [Hylemonella sp.]